MSRNYSLTPRLALSTINPVFDDKLEHSLWFSPLEFGKEAIYDGCRSENVRYGWGVLKCH